MKRKTKKKSAARPKSKNFKAKFAKFKKIVELELGKIDWRKVSVAVVVLLIIAAKAGVFGPQGIAVATVIGPFFGAA